MSNTTRIGYGEDAHRLEPGLPLWLGGIQIESPLGCVAHSDGDAVLHTISDALLSAFGLGDIGKFFPDFDPNLAGIDSKIILAKVLEKVAQNQSQLQQVSLVVTLDQPKLGPARDAIQQSLQHLLKLPPDRIGITFKTSEGLALNHIQCRAVVMLEQK